MKRAARSIRSGSSLKLISGPSGVRSVTGGEIGGTVERVDERRQVAVAGQLQRHRVDREVTA